MAQSSYQRSSMIMGIRRDLAAFALLAQLVTVSTGNIEVEGAIDKEIAKNVSIVVIENDGDGPVDLLRRRNLTNPRTGFDNSTTRAWNTTNGIDGNDMVTELEEALVDAASSGRVIVVELPDNGANSTATLQGPVIVIETPANVSKSLVNDVIDLADDKRKSGSSTLDQDIAQSQIRRKTTLPDYNDEENSENLEDLLAITEYEPQRIDAKSVNEEISRVSSDEFNSTRQSTKSLPRPEDTHYGVPKRTNPAENDRGVSNEASTNRREIIFDSRPTWLNRESPSTDSTKRKFSTIKPAASLKFDDKSIDEEIARGTRNSEIIIPLIKNSSAPTNLTDNEVATKNRLLGVGSSYNPTATFGQNSPVSMKSQPRNIYRIRNTGNTLRNNVHSIPNPVSGVSSPILSHHPLSRQKFLPANARTSRHPNQRVSPVPRASKRSDDYTNVDDTTSNNEKPFASFNHQNGYSKGDAKPITVAREMPNSRLYPVVTDYEQYEDSEELAEEELNDEEDDYEKTSPTSSRTTIPVDYLYENVGEPANNLRTTSKSAFVDNQKIDQHFNKPQLPSIVYPNDWTNSNVKVEAKRPLESYEQNVEESPGNQNPEKVRSLNFGNSGNRNAIYPRESLNGNSVVATTTNPAYDFYEKKVEEFPATKNHEKVRSLNFGNPETTDGLYPRKIANGNYLAATTTVPAYESYKQNVDQSLVNKKPGLIHSSKLGNQQAGNEIYPRNLLHANTVVAAKPILPHRSYEDEEIPNPPQRHHGLVPMKSQQQSASINPYVVPSTQVYQPYDYLGKSAHPVTATSSLANNPNYHLHGISPNPGFIDANVINDPSRNHDQRKPMTVTAPFQAQTTPDVPRRTSVRRNVISTTAAPDSHEDFEDSEDPPPTTHTPNNSNYANHRNDLPYYNLYKNNPNVAESTVSVPTRKLNSKYVSGQPIDNQYPLYQTRDKSLPTPERQNDRTIRNFAAESSTPGHLVNIQSDDNNFDDDKSYVAAATNLQYPNRSRGSKRHDRKYNLYKHGDEEDTVSTSDSGKLIGIDGPDDGSRVRARVVADGGKNVVSHYLGAALTAPGRSADVKRNYESRRRISVGVEEEPVEFVHRVDMNEAAYGDVVPVDPGQVEYQATRRHQTHAEAVGSGGGGGGGGEHKHEEGGGEKHEADHHEAHGEKGDKGYEDYHEYDKGKKGHHDKESHDKEYDEKKGDKKKHEDESGYHKEHHHGEKGDKEAEFAEKGEHQKGHSTKGEHVVHKKDEYEKKTEFYDESHEEDGHEKEGEYHHEHENKKGGHEKKGHHNSAHHEDKYGEKGEHEKGHHYHEKKGHDGKDGKDKHHEHHEKYGKKGGHEDGLKWSHEKADGGHGG